MEMKKQLKFLYLEDSDLDVQIFRSALLKEGWNVEVTHIKTREDFIRAIEQDRFDIIFSDYALPSFDGLSALEMVKNKCPETPFIIVSGNIGEELAIETLMRGATDYVLKNRFNRLIPSILRALQEKEDKEKIRNAIAIKTKFDFIVNTSRSFMSMINRDYTYEAINNAFCTAHSLLREEIIGKKLSELWGEESFRKAIKPNLDKSFANQEVHYQAWFDTPKYGRRCFEVSFFPFTDDGGNVTHTVVDTVDITEKKLAEQALKESEEKYRNLVELANDGIVIIQDGKIVYVNPFVTRLTGWSAEELLTRDFIQFVKPDLRESFAARLNETKMGDGIPHLLETVIIGKHNNPFSTELNIVMIKYEGDFAMMVLIRDLTERKKAQEALVESKERLQRVLDASNTGIWEWDISSQTIYFSPRWKAMIGYKDHEIKNEWDEWIKRIHPDDREKLMNDLRNYLEKPVGFFVKEFRMKHKNGSYRWIVGRSSAMVDDYGKAVRMSGSNLDITDRKITEEIIRESEEKFRNFTQQTPDGIIMADEQGHIIEWNPGMEQIMGYKKKETVGKDVWEFLVNLVDRKDRTLLDELRFRSDTATDETRYMDAWHGGSNEIRVKRKDGARKVLLMNVFPIRTAKGCMVGGVFRDVTGKIMAEAELRKSRDYLASLNNAISDAIISTRLTEHVIEFANNAAEKVFGYTRDELIGKNPEILYPGREEFKAFSEKLKGTLKQNLDSVRLEIQMRRKDGSLFDAELSVSFVQEENVPAMTLSIIRDITGRKLNEKRILQQTQDLRLINDLNELANVGGSIDEILSLLWERTRDIFGSKGGVIYIISPDGEKLVLQRNKSANKFFRKVEKAFKIGLGQLAITRSQDSLYWKPLFSRETYQVVDYENIEKLIAEHDNLTGMTHFIPLLTKLVGLQSMVNIPLISAGEPVGIFSIGKNTMFSGEDISRLEQFASQITSIIVKIVMEEKNRQQRDDLELISELNRAANEGKSLDEILYLLFEKTGKLFMGYGASILLMTEDRKRLKPALFGLTPVMLDKVQKITGLNLLQDTIIELKETSHYTRVIRSGQPVLCRSVDELVSLYREYVQNGTVGKTVPRVVRLLGNDMLLSVPLIYEDQCMGVLDIARKGMFNEQDIVRISAIAGQITSILARKLEEDRRRDSEVRYRTLFEGANDAILLLKHEIFIDCNRMAEELYGTASADIVGKTPADYSPEYQPNGLSSEILSKQFIQKAAEGQPQVFEWIHKKADGTLFWVEVRLTKVMLKDEQIIQAIMRDVSERKKSEEIQLRLMTAIEQSAEIVVITDIQGRILYANPAFEKTSGYSVKEALGKHPSMLKSGTHSRAFYENLWNTILSGRMWHGVFVNRHKNGSLFHEEATISPVKNEAGEIVNFVAVKRDVTREKQLEEQLQQSQKMETIGTLAGGLAHDFNNILATIMGYADMARKETDKNSELYDDLSNILRASERGKDLVRKILTFSRQFDTKSEPVDVARVVNESVQLLKGSVPASIKIKTSICTKCDPVMADPTQLQQVLFNLATNATYAMRNKEGILEVVLKQVNTDEELKNAFPALSWGSYIHLQVKDTGVGMDENTRERIFEPFFTTKPVGEGTGLGLPVAHGIIKHTGGEIFVESEPGKGSVFHVFLPVHKAEQELLTENVRENEAVYGTERILFVDDDREITTMAKKMLGKIGYHITVANDPLEALNLFMGNPSDYDMLITDMVMPEMTGEKLAAEILHIRPAIPVILVTSYRETVIPERITSTGISRFLFKPLTITELGTTIRQLFETTQNK